MDPTILILLTICYIIVTVNIILVIRKFHDINKNWFPGSLNSKIQCLTLATILINFTMICSNGAIVLHSTSWHNAADIITAPPGYSCHQLQIYLCQLLFVFLAFFMSGLWECFQFYRCCRPKLSISATDNNYIQTKTGSFLQKIINGSNYRMVTFTLIGMFGMTLCHAMDYTVQINTNYVICVKQDQCDNEPWVIFLMILISFGILLLVIHLVTKLNTPNNSPSHKSAEGGQVEPDYVSDMSVFQHWGVSCIIMIGFWIVVNPLFLITCCNPSKYILMSLFKMIVGVVFLFCSSLTYVVLQKRRFEMTRSLESDEDVEPEK